MKKVFLAVAALALLACPAFAQNYNTAGQWDSTGAVTIPSGGNSSQVTSVTYGHSSVTSHTFTASDTGNAAAVVPENSVGADEVAVIVDSVILCGQADENGTIYYGPATAIFGADGSDASIGSTACDALDNATEATVDAPILTDLSFKIMGMWCETDGTLGAAETVVFTARTAAADVVTTDGSATALTCSLAEGETECSVVAGSTTDVAAGATIAVKSVHVSDNADDNDWCRMIIGIK